ncbi:putative membrane protein YdjX (TVP38/TMEM64 family) [Melghirimyces profundicolus]|uniref:TVP38/TMEM64 family membrane protein n=1 Tax=Melghirimyces profundicolus TaxID=1242148 RepID=A0A2T6C9T7_9BACL|nr:VTT domain-containing protein [Melghirimyces profundicolus]PTX65072.1 putative membrane protein YdjX (TVP38/TMEM64 family) [Melghirimyces profundicolus]
MVHEVAEGLESLGGWGIITALLITSLGNLLGFVPSVTFTGANVLLWGPVGGGTLSWLGEVLGAVASFHLFRTGYRIGAGKKTPDWRWIRRLNRWPARRQFLSVLAARLTPFVPSGAVNLLGALTTLRFRDFMLATAIGKVPSVALEVLVTFDLIHIRENGWRLATVLIALLLIWGVWRGTRKEEG